ncbi:unnamed protein product [Bemisia tabaci]|uniref:Nucleolar protein 12 n=1 Tax=Bemisia tabaci TaxID=7038 RepID=A0A9P0F470_BEMTA|nr:unnamed protein product [Bemisia tabaci]
MDLEDFDQPKKIIRAKKAINKKTKVHIVFDEKARRDYLTGFSKRKQARKKKAEEEFKVLLKEEKKRIKQEARESYMKLTKSFEPVPEVEHLQTEEYDLGTHSVCITELSTDEIAKHNNWIGANRPVTIKEEEKKKCP